METKTGDVKTQVAEMKNQAEALLDKLTPKPAETKPEEPPKATEVKAETPKTEDLQQRVVSLQKQLDEWQTTAKSHQKATEKEKAEVQRLQAQVTSVEAMRQRLEVLTQMVADMMDTTSSEEIEDKPKQRRSEQYLKRLDEATKKTQEEAMTAQQREHQRIINEVVAQLQTANLQIAAMDSEEFIKAKLKFLEGKPSEGLEEVKRIVQAKTEAKPKETDEEKFERMYNERRKKEMKEKGELGAETGQPAGTAGSRFSREALRNYDARNKGIKDLIKDRDALLNQLTK